METLTGNGTLFEGDDTIADVTYTINVRKPPPTARNQLPTITGLLSTEELPNPFWRLYDKQIICLLHLTEHEYKLLVTLKDGEGTIMPSGNLEPL